MRANRVAASKRDGSSFSVRLDSSGRGGGWILQKKFKLFFGAPQDLSKARNNLPVQDRYVGFMDEIQQRHMAAIGRRNGPQMSKSASGTVS